MGDFNKKRDFGFGVILGVVVGATAFLANVSEIVQLFNKDDKPEKTENPVSIVESVDKNVTDTVIEQAYVVDYNSAEAVEDVISQENYVIAVESVDKDVKETVIEQAYVVGDNYVEAVEETIIEQN
ncbi:MAG: hypothetical protein NC205_06415 [Prevotella sp.]|nr:hypothetical protein [Alistipes senegalensis]MCM1358211.1 hypothetical protein [Prevotella sp.]MCM1474120.1 hypothetical protein [Muribaculaceae bacterium]